METQEIVQSSVETPVSPQPSDQVSGVEQVNQIPAPDATKTGIERLGEVQKATKAKAAEKAQAAAGVPPPAAFVPNWKVKALDKEHDMPEWFRGSVKDAETEKLAREMFLKSLGLDHIKPKYQEIRTKHQELETAHNTLRGQVQELQGFYKAGDLDSFFERMGIPMEKILQYAVQKVQFNELPPEQREIIDARKRAEAQTRTLEQEKNTFQEQALNHAVEAKNWQMELVLQRPETADFAAAYDQARNKPGAFREIVIRTGQAAFATRQVDLSVDEAVKEAMEMIGPMSRHSPAAMPTAQHAAPAPAATSPAKKVIPNIQGKSSTSPVKSQYKSLEDLKKAYDEKFTNRS